MTIAQAAAALGVSAKTIYKRLSKGGKTSGFTLKENGVTVLTPSGLDYLGITQNMDDKRYNDGNTMVIQALTAHIQDLQRQIEAKDTQIAVLQQLVSQQQQLAMANRWLPPWKRQKSKNP